MDLFGAVAAILAIIVLYWYLSVPRNLPPGSAGLPILGYLPFLNTNTYITFTQLQKKYGNVFYLYMGSRLVLVLNDFESIKQALQKQGDDFAGRTQSTQFGDENGESAGIIMTDGEYWKQHRRFILRNLRDNGVGKLSLEPLILTEIQQFVHELKNLNGKGNFNMKDYLTSSLTNNVHILVHGKRYDYEHKAIRETLKLFKNFDKYSQVFPFDIFFPLLKPIVKIWHKKRLAKLWELKSHFIKIMEEIVLETKSELVNNESEYYVHAYLNERNNRLNNNKNEQIFTEIGLLHNIIDLIGAGTDTSATILAWAALYMAKYPHIQQKAQAEIDRVIGQREPSYNDRNNTPYTEATICEIHRVVSLTPLSVPHRVMQDTTFYGYNIPRDTMVFPNIWAVHNDEKLWGDPDNFRPERFIGPSGDCVKPEYLIPFSIGKRACAGEPLARMELYLYFVSLLQHFTFHPPLGVKKITFDSPPGLFTRQPKINLIRVKSRQ